MKKKRILWIDGLKLFAILLVVWGHVLSRMGNIPLELKYTGTAGWIYSFHMPLFMTLSGFVSAGIMSGKGNVVRKFRQLIVPCISLAVICFFIRFDENFWYLKSLFLCYVICLGYFKFECRFKLPLMLLLCVVLFPFITRVPLLGSYKVDFMLPFFAMGLFLQKYSEPIGQHLLELTCFSCILFIICEFLWSPEYIWYNSRPNWIDYKALVTSGQLLFNVENVIQVVFRYFTGAVASCFFIFLFQLIFSAARYEKPLAKVAGGGGILYTSTFSKPSS